MKIRTRIRRVNNRRDKPISRPRFRPKRGHICSFMNVKTCDCKPRIIPETASHKSYKQICGRWLGRGFPFIMIPSLLLRSNARKRSNSSWVLPTILICLCIFSQFCMDQAEKIAVYLGKHLLSDKTSMFLSHNINKKRPFPSQVSNRQRPHRGYTS